MRILVTGSEGYIGSYLVPFLEEKGHTVYLYDLKLGHDILNERQVFLEMRECDAVIHLAAIVGDPKCAENTEEAIMTNQEGIGIVVRMARAVGIKKLIYASTCSVYGTNHRETCTIDSDPNPLSVYAWTKFIGEQIVLMNGYQALRFGTAFGITPNMRYNLIINGMWKNAKEGKPIWIFNKENYRPFAHVKTICKAIHRALYTNTPLKNVVNFNATIEQVGRFMCSLMKIPLIDKGHDSDRRSYKVEC